MRNNAVITSACAISPTGGAQTSDEVRALEKSYTIEAKKNSTFSTIRRQLNHPLMDNQKTPNHAAFL